MGSFIKKNTTINSLIKSIQYYRRVYKRFGYRALAFLFSSKFNNRKKDQLKIFGIKYPISLSNFENDVTTLFQIFFSGEYDIKMKKTPEIIIDCGANIGLSAVFFANKFPVAHIIAIEPDKENFKILLLNTSKYPHITCLQKAIWPYSEKLEVVDPGSGNWGLQTKKMIHDSGQTIDAITLDEIMKQYRIEIIDLLKIDIEGAEKELFSAHHEYWLSRTSVIAIELHDFLDPSISPVFFKAIEPFKFRHYQLGENLICEKEIE